MYYRQPNQLRQKRKDIFQPSPWVREAVRQYIVLNQERLGPPRTMPERMPVRLDEPK
jgi:hypothetical protein